jgi:hypothetical protein
VSRLSPATVLAAIVAILLTALVALWITPQGGLRNTEWQPPAAVRPDFSAAPSPDRGGGDMDRFMAVLDRPLFSPTRQAPPARTAAAQPVVDPMANVQIHGTFSGPAGAAILARIDGKARTVRVNEAIGEWTLKEVKDRDAIFAKGDETRVLQRARAKPAGAAPPASADAGGAAGAAAAQAAPNAPVGGATVQQRIQQEERERLARRNAIRARAGLPPVPE